MTFEKNKECLNKTLGLAKELEQAVATYLSAKRGVWNALEDDSLKKLRELYTSLHHQQHIVFMRISKKTISVLEVAFSILIVVPF